VKEDEWMPLLMADPPVPRVMERGRWIEVDRKKQLLLYCIDGAVERTLPVSTGTPSILYGQETPLGVFHIISKNKRERKPRYHPMYIRTWGNLAIHGYEYVPARNVSHGCIRITIADMDEFYEVIPVGTPVYIYE
jgi:lipoprotein-anchoring transpeptidase ErfK/SrfK